MPRALVACSSGFRALAGGSGGLQLHEASISLDGLRFHGPDLETLTSSPSRLGGQV